MQGAARLRSKDFRSVQPGSSRPPGSMMLMDMRRQRRCKESVCDVGPWSSRKSKYAAYFVRNCPSQCLSVNQLFSDLRYHWSILSHRWVNHSMSCMTSTANGYSLNVLIHIWNEFLPAIYFELREVSSEELALAGLCGRLVSDASNMQRRYSFGVVHWLLMKHCCIKFVEPSESHVTHNHFLLLRDFWLSRNLGNVKLCRDRSDDYLHKELVDAFRSAVTTLGMPKIMGVRFRGVGLYMLCEVLAMCEVPTACARFLVGRRSTLYLPVNQLFWNLRYLRSILSHHRVNNDNCRTASEFNVCFLLVELSLWNEFLWVSFELRAVSSPRLALACRHGRVVPTCAKRQRRHSFVGVPSAVTEWCSNNLLELCEPGISESHFLFQDGLHLSRNVWYVKLCLLEGHSPGYLAETLHQSVTTLDRLEGGEDGFSNFRVQTRYEL